MEDKLKQILASVLCVDPASIGPDSSPDTIESWDSAAQMNLVLALEEEFGVQFTEMQIVEMMSYELILATLREVVA